MMLSSIKMEALMSSFRRIKQDLLIQIYLRIKSPTRYENLAGFVLLCKIWIRYLLKKNKN